MFMTRSHNNAENTSRKYDWTWLQSHTHSRFDSIRLWLRRAQRMFIGAGKEVYAEGLPL